MFYVSVIYNCYYHSAKNVEKLFTTLTVYDYISKTKAPIIKTEDVYIYSYKCTDIIYFYFESLRVS
jgi:hypothetical protein